MALPFTRHSALLTPSHTFLPPLFLPGISKAELDVDESCASLRLAQKRRLLHVLNRPRPSPGPPPAPPPPPNEPGVLTVLSGMRFPDGMQSPLDHVRNRIGDGARGLLRHFAGRSKRTRLASGAEGGDHAAALGYDDEEGGGEQANSGAEATASYASADADAGAIEAEGSGGAAGGRAESEEADERTEGADDDDEDFLEGAINLAERATGLDIDRDGDTGVRNPRIEEDEEEVEHDELRMRARHRRRLQQGSSSMSSSWDERL